MKNKVIEVLENLSSEELVRIHNEYCDNVCYDDYIQDMWSFDDIMSGTEPSRLANMIYYGDFRPNDNYFMFDGYGNLKSFDYPEDVVDFDALAEYIIEDDEDFEVEELAEILQGGKK